MDERPGAVQGDARERPGAVQGTARDQELEEEEEEEVELPNTSYFLKIMKHLHFFLGENTAVLVFSYYFIRQLFMKNETFRKFQSFFQRLLFIGENV